MARGTYWARAECLTCGWKLTANNAHGCGARHAKTKRHLVVVDVERGYSYDYTGRN